MIRILIFLFVFGSVFVQAQDRPYWKEIQAFKVQDSLQKPPKKKIVFVGSSSFRLWKDVQKDFPGKVIINRGFGGSSLPHVIEYADQIVIPYKPRQVVIYCGENDFTNEAVTADDVRDRFITLYNLLRKRLPRAEIVYVSMKPSPSRRHRMEKMQKANHAIRDFLATQRRTAYIDIWDAMLDEQGEPRKELFVADMLHMNSSGYAIWQKAIAPHLK